MGAPCGWDISASLACCPQWATYPPDVQAAATAFGTEVVWALSGRQFGVCPVTVRPCARCVGQTYRTYGVWLDGYSNGAVSPTWWPYIDSGGVWRNCGCQGACSCEPSQQVWLPGPVRSITEVRVNNVIVNPANYRLDFANGLFWLVGQNGQQWPECQNFDVPASSTDNTFVVVYAGEGVEVPTGGLLSAASLACEYAKLCTGADCALSAAATAITRDGVSYEILSPSDLISKGFTPLPNVNQWIYSVNPYGNAERPRVWSPDDDMPRITIA